jgi:ubiquinone/menaquinone biosynthesis C-methylase UbiE
VVREAAERGFSRAADAYDRGRPEYPPEALDWLCERLRIAAGSEVADVGAGTGKLTRPLVERGVEVVAIEPVAAMRARLAAALPRARALEASAERLPLDDASIDAVVAGQAFHWFDGPRALDEFHRVLRRGAGLGLIWNRRRLDQPLQAAISELLEPYRGEVPRHDSDDWREAFERSDRFVGDGRHEVEFEQRLDQDGLVDRVGSISFIAVLAGGERDRLIGRVRELGAEHAPIRLAYSCEVFTYARRA